MAHLAIGRAVAHPGRQPERVDTEAAIAGRQRRECRVHRPVPRDAAAAEHTDEHRHRACDSGGEEQRPARPGPHARHRDVPRGRGPPHETPETRRLARARDLSGSPHSRRYHRRPRWAEGVHALRSPVFAAHMPTAISAPEAEDLAAPPPAGISPVGPAPNGWRARRPRWVTGVSARGGRTRSSAPRWSPRPLTAASSARPRAPSSRTSRQSRSSSRSGLAVEGLVEEVEARRSRRG